MAETRIGWIGTGVMGASMCGHLLSAGYKATVTNRSRAKAEPLLAKGAQWADTPRQVAERSDVVFSIVGYPADVRSVTLGPEGSLVGSNPGTILVDMTTSEPSLAIEIYEAAKAKDVHSVDAPVSGGDVGAREARLSIMIGGDDTVVERLLPLFQTMGKTIVRQGGARRGSAHQDGQSGADRCEHDCVCEGLLYAYRAGLDLNRVLESVASGAAGSKSLDIYAPRIIANNFSPGFYVEHFIKDMGIALTEAKRMGLALPGLALAQQLYWALAAQGHGRDGTQSLELALASLSGIDWKNQ